MTRRRIGLGIAGLGILLTVVGIVGALSSGDPATDPVASETTLRTATTSTSVSVDTTGPTTTTSPPRATAATSTSTSTSTTTTSTTTPPSIDPVALVQAFVEDFSNALDTGDREFILGRLHPAVIEAYGAELCSTWVDTEIMALSSYQLTSEPQGPVDEVVSTPTGSSTITDSFNADVSFTFQGEEFTGGAGFALIDGQVFWLGQCR